VRVISRKKLVDFWSTHPDAESPLARWFKVVERADWTCFSDIRATYAHADQVGKFVVFNVGGNKFRVIAEVFYDDRVMLLRHALTHQEYDRGHWKSS
jgi:mRNA interferase HigB